MHTNVSKPFRWGRLWLIGSLAWIVFMVSLAAVHMHWPSIDEVREERLSRACKISPFSEAVALNQLYPAYQLREMASSPEAFARVLSDLAAKRNAKRGTVYKLPGRESSQWGRVRPDELAAAPEKWTPELQYCVRSLDVDYKVMRRRAVAIQFAPWFGKIISGLMWFSCLILVFWLGQRFR